MKNASIERIGRAAVPALCWPASQPASPGSDWHATRRPGLEEARRRTSAGEGAYSARGAYGQYITVIPALHMVVVHKTVPEDRTSWNQYMGVLRRLVEARTTPAC